MCRVSRNVKQGKNFAFEKRFQTQILSKHTSVLLATRIAQLLEVALGEHELRLELVAGVAGAGERALGARALVLVQAGRVQSDDRGDCGQGVVGGQSCVGAAVEVEVGGGGVQDVLPGQFAGHEGAQIARECEGVAVVELWSEHAFGE